MPDKEHSKRYIHIQQSFIEYDTNLDLTEQRLHYICEKFSSQTDLSAGKCLILGHTIDAVNYLKFYINA